MNNCIICDIKEMLSTYSILFDGLESQIDTFTLYNKSTYIISLHLHNTNEPTDIKKDFYLLFRLS